MAGIEWATIAKKARHDFGNYLLEEWFMQGWVIIQYQMKEQGRSMYLFIFKCGQPKQQP